MKNNKDHILDRRDTILKSLHESKVMKVETLAEICGVSIATMRRDIKYLENNDLIYRSKGEVWLKREHFPLLSFDAKKSISEAGKEKIARYLADYIPEHITLFCNSGSTTFAIMKQLMDKSVSIVTNNAEIFPVFQSEQQLQLLSTGGNYDSHTKSFTGEHALHMLNEVYADLCILGFCGVDADNGALTMQPSMWRSIEKWFSTAEARLWLRSPATRSGKVRVSNASAWMRLIS